MISSYALEKGGILEFPDGNYELLTAFDRENSVFCTLKKEGLKCVKTMTFKKIGKSEIDLGDCINYTPPKKVVEVGQRYGDMVIREVLRETENDWRCLVSHIHSFSCFYQKIKPSI